MRARVKEILSQEESPDKLVKLEALTRAAQKVDSDLEAWVSSLGHHWGPITVAIQFDTPHDPSQVEQWPGPVHIYDDLFTANITNDYRISRIFCQKVLLACTAEIQRTRKDPWIYSVSQRARYISQQMVDEICASVPFHMQYSKHPKEQTFGQDEAGELTP